MKRLALLVTAAAIICFCATLTQAQNNGSSIKQIQYNEEQCSLFFGQVLGNKADLDLFEDEVEFFLETGYFWEACLFNQLKNGKNVILNYTGYTNTKHPQKELKLLIKSAAKFKEELEDYIEEQMPKQSFLRDGSRYIFLQTDKGLNLNNKLQKYIKKENKKFNNNLNSGKIIINIKTEYNEENTGGILIETIL